jgi:hypothetical protein
MRRRETDQPGTMNAVSRRCVNTPGPASRERTGMDLMALIVSIVALVVSFLMLLLAISRM